jgi:hypothetical protein
MCFQAKACPALDAGWARVRVKKTRQKYKDRALVLINQNRGSKPKDGLKLHNALAFASAFAVL